MDRQTGSIYIDNLGGADNTMSVGNGNYSVNDNYAQPGYRTVCITFMYIV